MYLCLCKGIKEADVKCLARSGCTSEEDLIAGLGLDDESACGRCLWDIDRFVEVAQETAPIPLTSAA